MKYDDLKPRIAGASVHGRPERNEPARHVTHKGARQFEGISLTASVSTASSEGSGRDVRHPQSADLLRVSLITYGDPETLSGGYLYNRRMARAAPRHRATVRFVSFPERPFPIPALSARRCLTGAADSCDVVVVDSIAAALVAPALVRKRPSVPMVGLLHQPPGGLDHSVLRQRIQTILDAAAYRASARLIAASASLAAELAGTGWPEDLIDVVAPGCDVGTPASDPGDLRQGRAAALVCVANWIPRKGILELLDALSLLPQNCATLHLVGHDRIDQHYADEVRARVRDPRLNARVIVHGPVDQKQVAAMFGAADAFVMASTREPYGTVYAEAMLAGLPVLGWHAGNLPHLARHEREGLMAPVGDIAALANMLRQVCEDEHLRARLSAGALRRARTFPSWDQAAASFFASLREVAAGPPVLAR